MAWRLIPEGDRPHRECIRQIQAIGFHYSRPPFDGFDHEQWSTCTAPIGLDIRPLTSYGASPRPPKLSARRKWSVTSSLRFVPEPAP